MLTAQLHLGYGIRIEPYEFTENELISAIKRLLDDAKVQTKCQLAGMRIQTSMSKEKLCQQIEQVVAKFRMEKAK